MIELHSWFATHNDYFSLPSIKSGFVYVFKNKSIEQ